MPAQTPRASMPRDLNVAASRAWFSFKTMHPATSADPMAVGIQMYQRGWRDCFLASSEVAGLVPLLERLLECLEHERVESDLVSLGQGQ